MKRKMLALIIGLTLSSSLFACSSNESLSDITPPPSANIDDSNNMLNPENLEPVLPKEEAPTPSVGPLGLPNDTTSPNKNEAPPKAQEATKEKPANPNPAPVNPAPPIVPEAVNPPTPPQVDTTGDFLATVEKEIFNMVNMEREKAGVPKLSYNSTMEKYARMKSKDMGVKNYFSHEDPNGNLITRQMRNDGVSYRAWGENIAYTSSPETTAATQFMNNWMNSEGHRKNILSTDFTGIGIGVCKVNGKIYATQEFIAK